MNGKKTTAPLHLCLWLVPVVLALSIGCGRESQSLTGPSAVGDSARLLAGDGPSATTAADAGSFETLGRGRGNGNGNGHGRGGDSDRGRGDDAREGGPGRGDNGHRGPGRGGNDDDGDDDNGHDNRGPRRGDDNPGRRDDARIVGFVSATGGNTITVNGTVIAAGLDAIVRHGNRLLTLADIEVGDHVQARGTMEDEVLVASEIKVEDTGRDNDDVVRRVELEGVVAGLSPASGCPVLTFTIGTTTVSTSVATIYDDVTCATLATDAFVEVHGIRQADGSVLATRIDAEAGPDEVEGRVFEFSGAASCPAATFRVGPTLSLSTRVTTTAATVFADVTCAALADGVRVEVEGTKQADGSIAAARVELE